MGLSYTSWSKILCLISEQNLLRDFSFSNELLSAESMAGIMLGAGRELMKLDKGPTCMELSETSGRSNLKALSWKEAGKED